MIQSFTDRHQDWFYFPVIVNRAGMYMMLNDLCEQTIETFRLYSRELYSWVMRCFYLLTLERPLHRLPWWPRQFTVLSTSNYCSRLPIPLQYLLPFVFPDILTGVKWLQAVSVCMNLVKLRPPRTGKDFSSCTSAKIATFSVNTLPLVDFFFTSRCEFYFFFLFLYSVPRIELRISLT